MSTAGFFTGVTGKAISWPDNPPKKVSGTILAVNPPEEILDIRTRKPTGKYQVRIVLQTDERNPEIEDDDGVRTLYVKSWMKVDIGDALKNVGEREPKVGGHLTVDFSYTTPAAGPGLSPSKRFEVTYVPPSATGGFFTSPSYTVSNGAVKPASIAQGSWDAMDESTKAAVSKTMAGAQDPPF